MRNRPSRPSTDLALSQVTSLHPADALPPNLVLRRGAPNSEGHSRLALEEASSLESRRLARQGGGRAACAVQVRAPARFVSLEISSAGELLLKL